MRASTAQGQTMYSSFEFSQMPTKRRVEFRFRMTAYSPETLPMARLVEYLAELAVLLGHPASVHFMKIERGSAVPVIAVDREDAPKVQKRVASVKRGDGPADAREAVQKIDRWLADDDASGELLGPTGSRLLKFPGRERAATPEYGLFTQPATLDGVVIVIGGERDPVPLHLQDGEVVHNCWVSRELAKQLAPHLFGNPIRVAGNGRWKRDVHEQWEMVTFTVSSFEPLRDENLGDAVARLRNVSGDWKTSADPIGDLMKIRTGDRKH
jgi:hypothetical protein